MNRYDWYFEQIVSQGEMDQAFDWVGDAISGMASDAGYTGIQFGLTAVPTVPLADLNVQISGPGGGVDKLGERIYSGLALEAVDCSVDEYGAPTTVTAPAHDRYVSIFARHKVDLSVPKIDGNSLEVFTRRTDAYEYIVRQGAEAATGFAIPPALLADALLVNDVLLSFGMTQITIAEIESTRREDWVRYNGTTIGTLAYGTSKAATLAVLAMLDTWGATMPFVPTDMWFDAALPAGSAPPVGDVQAALNAIVYDLALGVKEISPPGGSGADRIGTHGYDTANHYVTWGVGAGVSLQTALQAIADAVDGHIAGGAPAHPAASVTTAIIPGVPEAEMAISDVQAVLVNIFAHLNARTEKAVVETVTAAWTFGSGDTNMMHASQQNKNVNFDNNPWAKTFGGGSTSPHENFFAIASGIHEYGSGWSHMWGSGNSLPTGMAVIGSGVIRVGVSGTRYVVFVVGDGMGACGAVSFDPNNYVDTDVVINLATGLPGGGMFIPTAACTDGESLYVMFFETGAGTHHIQAWTPRTGAVKATWPATGRLLPGNGVGANLAMSDAVKPVMLQSVNPFAASNLLATLNSWNKCNVASTSNCVSIIDADDGGIHGSGSGDCPDSAVSDIWPQGALCTDGTNVLFGYWNETSGAGGMASCTIADPEVTSGIGSFPYQINPTAFPRDALFDGDMMWVTNNYDKHAPHTVPTLSTWEKANDNWTNQAIPVLTSDFAHGNGIGHIAFDGLNIWLEALYDIDDNGTSNVMVLYKIPTDSAHPTGAVPLTNPDAERRQMIAYVEGPDEVATMLAADMGRLMFDGESIWCSRCGKIGAIGVGSMAFRRLARAGMR